MWGPARESGGRINQHIYTPEGSKVCSHHSLNTTFCKPESVLSRPLEATSRSCDIICNIRKGPCFESGPCVMTPERAKVVVIGKLGIAEK